MTNLIILEPSFFLFRALLFSVSSKLVAAYSQSLKVPASEGKDAIWINELRQVVQAIDQRTLIGIRNRALLVLGWAGALRRSELVSLDIEDISKTRDGLILHLNQSKTDQKGKGQEIALPYGSNALTCPVRSLENWLAASGILEGPLFRKIDHHGNLLGRLTP